MCGKLFQLVERGRLCLQIKAENKDHLPGHQVRPRICSDPVWGRGAVPLTTLRLGPLATVEHPEGSRKQDEAIPRPG